LKNLISLYRALQKLHCRVTLLHFTRWGISVLEIGNATRCQSLFEIGWDSMNGIYFNFLFIDWHYRALDQGICLADLDFAPGLSGRKFYFAR